MTNLLLILALMLFLFDIAYRRLNLDFSKYIKINIRNKKKKVNENNFLKEEMSIEKERNNIKTDDIASDDSIKEKVKKKDKNPKAKKKKKEETPKPKTLDTSALLKKKNDRNGI